MTYIKLFVDEHWMKAKKKKISSQRLYIKELPGGHSALLENISLQYICLLSFDVIFFFFFVEEIFFSPKNL